MIIPKQVLVLNNIMLGSDMSRFGCQILKLDIETNN